MEENHPTEPFAPPPPPPRPRRHLPVWAIVSMSVASVLVVCCGGLVALGASPIGQKFAAESAATQTAQSISAAYAHQTATAYAVEFPKPTAIPKPTATTKPTTTSKPTATMVATPKPTATTIPVVPITFTGLGGTTDAFVKAYTSSPAACGEGIYAICAYTTIDGCQATVSAFEDSSTINVKYTRIEETSTTYNCSILQYPNQTQTTTYCKTLLPSDAQFQQNVATISGSPAQQEFSQLLANTLQASDFSAPGNANDPGGAQNPPGTFYVEEGFDRCTASTLGNALT